MQHYRMDPALSTELAAFGGSTLGRCFSCGNCTAVCGLSKGDTVFPRKITRYLQVGLSDRLLESPEPWLCYYCGTCSDTCPRSAEPGELMMATRRWLVSHYDWTGLSRRLYLSEAWELGLLGGIAALVLALFLVPGWLGLPFGFAAIDAAATEHVRLDLFAPNPVVHAGDLTLAALLALLLGINAVRMAGFVARGRGALTIPLSIWLGKAYEFVLFVLGRREKPPTDALIAGGNQAGNDVAAQFLIRVEAAPEHEQPACIQPPTVAGPPVENAEEDRVPAAVEDLINDPAEWSPLHAFRGMQRNGCQLVVLQRGQRLVEPGGQ